MNPALTTIAVFLPLIPSLMALFGVLREKRLWALAVSAHVASWLCFTVVLAGSYLSSDKGPFEGLLLLGPTPWSGPFRFHWDFWSIFLAWVASGAVVSLHFLASAGSRALVASMSAFVACFLAALGAGNLFLFGVAIAGAVLPRFVMISLDGAENKIQIAMEAAVFSLIAVLAIFTVVLSIASGSMPSWIGIEGERYEVTASTIGFFLLFVAAMIISGIFPFHSNMRKIYGLNRLYGMVPLVLQSVLGIFLMFRFSTQYFPEQIRQFGPVLLYFYAAAALVSSIGFCGSAFARDRIFWLQQVLLCFSMIGFFSLNQKGWLGGSALAAFQALAIPALLFLSISLDKRGSGFVGSKIADFPWMGVASILLPLIALGAPLSLGFYCFVLVLWSLAGGFSAAIPVALLAIPVCAFGGMRIMFFRLGESESGGERIAGDFSPSEFVAVYPSIIFLLLMGIAPGIFLAPIGATVAVMLKAMN